MAGYNENFARYYDSLTSDVDYAAHADYLIKLISSFKDRCQLVLDLACGTGSLAVELAKRGLEVIGVDGSQEMLACAMSKSMEATPRILYLCQPMEKLDLYGTVEVALCTLDSLNHVEGKENLREVLRRVRLFVEPGGLFLFDMNTVYKHTQVLAGSTYVRENSQVYCVWQNTLDPRDNSVDIDLDFFVSQGKDRYHRYSENFREYVYTVEEMTQLLEQAGFELLGLRGDYTDAPPAENEERIIYITRRK